MNPKTAQALARHSTIGLTMDKYAHSDAASRADAIELLPDFRAPGAGEMRATGTHGENCLSSCLPISVRRHETSCDNMRQPDALAMSRETALPLDNLNESGVSRVHRASGGMADASDLKSDSPNREWGFESPLAHR